MKPLSAATRSTPRVAILAFVALLLVLAERGPAATGSPGDPAPQEPYLRTVHFEVAAPDARAVVLSGTMTLDRPDGLPLRRTGGGVWYVNAPVAPGRHSYVFLVDGRPVLDDASPSEDDGAGGLRSTFVLDDDREALPPEGLPRGKVALRKVRSRALGADVPVNVYTPPGLGTRERLPLLVLLHGSGMDERQWVVGGIPSYVDRYVASGLLPRLLVVMPGLASDPSSGATERFLASELVPWAARTYRARTGAAATAIGGMSLGGGGAFFVALRHPDVFGHAMVLSPGLPDPAALDRLDAELAAGTRVRPSVDLRCGLGDDLVRPFSDRLASILAAHGVRFGYEVTRGGHDWETWHAMMRPALTEVGRFLRRGAGAVEPRVPSPPRPGRS